MRGFVKGYFIVMFILSLLTGLGAVIASLAFFVTLIVPIVALPMGILMLVACSKFIKAVSMSDEKLVEKRGSLLGWGIFVAIIYCATFIGFIIMLTCAIIVNNQIKNI